MAYAGWYHETGQMRPHGLGAASKPDRWLTGCSVRAVSIVLHNDSSPEPDGTVGQLVVAFWSRPKVETVDAVLKWFAIFHQSPFGVIDNALTSVKTIGWQNIGWTSHICQSIVVFLLACYFYWWVSHQPLFHSIGINMVDMSGEPRIYAIAILGNSLGIDQ